MKNTEEKNEDETDGINKDKIKSIFQQNLEEFEGLIAEKEDKESLISSLIKSFTILLTTKCSSISKLKKMIKISAEIAIKL